MAPIIQKALIIPAEKEPFKLVADWPVPQPGPTDVLVKLVSVALNPVDAFVQAVGIPGLVPGYPCVLGIDGSGTVEEVGADVKEVARGIGLDNRIGSKFLHAGPGYGGSCFPKDTLALMRIAQDWGAPSRLVEATVSVNDARSQAARYSQASMPSCAPARRSSWQLRVVREDFEEVTGVSTTYFMHSMLSWNATVLQQHAAVM